MTILRSVTDAAGDAKCLVDQRLDRGERAIALTGQLLELRDESGDGSGRRIDRQQALLHHDERKWLSSKDAGYLVALLHSRVQFIGEMLSLLEQSRTPDDLLQLANDQYAMGWTTRAQIDRRRGWLQSAGAVQVDDEGLLHRTALGSSVLNRLQLHLTESPAEPETRKAGVSTPRARTEESSDLLGVAHTLTERLRAAAQASDEPEKFEQAATDAFRFLGFDSAWLGGSGKTDVLVVADLGPGEGYRVIVDCKTTGRAAVQDQQIDWITLGEHRVTHEADHVVVLAGAFQGPRIRERATQHEVCLLEVETLCTLLAQHARLPVGLEAYRGLFGSSDPIGGAAGVAEVAEEATRWLRLSAEIVRLVRVLESTEGAVTARDLYWNLRELGEELGTYATEEIQTVLDALSAPALGVLRRVGQGYKSLGSLQTMQHRVHLLATMSGSGGTGSEESSHR